MIDPKAKAMIQMGRFEMIPEPLFFIDAGPLAQMVSLPALCERMHVHDPKAYLQEHRARAVKDGIWPEDEAAILWLLLALEMSEFDPSLRPARYLNVLTDQLREALLEVAHDERPALLAYIS